MHRVKIAIEKSGKLDLNVLHELHVHVCYARTGHENKDIYGWVCTTTESISRNVSGEYGICCPYLLLR